MPEHVADPVFSAFELPLRRTFFPLGYPLVLETNSHHVMLAAEEGWGANERMFNQDPVRVSLGVNPGDSEAPSPASVIRAREHLMSIIAGPENFLQCDFDRGFAFGWVTENTAADHPLLRYRFLVSGGATLVEQRAFASLHGALVARNGTGVMLAGDSFAGKSTLSYACARAGWTYVSDDSVSLPRSRHDRYAIGDPYSIRFRPDAPALFPELSDRMVTIRPNGKVAIELLTRDLELNTAPGCHVDHIVYLNRSEAVPAGLRQLSKERVLEGWAAYTSFGTKETRAAQRRCHERMLGAQLWQMQYSDLDDAIARLERLVDSGA